jgi:hypothetical protein
MPDLTRRPDPSRANSWLIHSGDVHIGTIARTVGNPVAEPGSASPAYAMLR